VKVINFNINASPEGLPRFRDTYNVADYLIPFSFLWDAGPTGQRQENGIKKYPENLVDPVLIKEVNP